METKDTLSSCSYSDEQDMQQMLKRAKILKGSCLNGLSALKSNFTRKLEQGITKSEFERAFSHIFGEDVDTFTRTFSQNMDTLEQQLTKETILESNCQNAFRVLKTQFEKIFTSVLIKPSSLDGTYARKDFHAYTGMEPQLFKETILKNFDFIEEYMLKTIIHAQTIQKSSGIVSNKGNDQSLENQSNTSRDESSRSKNECNDKSTSSDDTDIRPSYDTEPMVENDQNVVECEDECVALANLIENLKLDIDENKRIQKTLGESNSVRDSCLVALQNKQTEFERYKAFNDRTVNYDKLERKLNETLGLLAQKAIDIKEGLKVKAYEISVVKEKHDELVKQSLLTKSHYEGLVKEKTKVITDLKLKEEKDIDKMISMENQLKFLNKIVYKMSQSIQTIYMLAPKCPTFNGRPTFANPMYLKKAQEIFNQAWVKHSKYHFRAPTAKDMEILIKTCLMPLALKTQNDSFAFVHELKKEMHADLMYVESLENEIDKLKSDKAKFSNMYDMLLQECVSNDGKMPTKIELTLEQSQQGVSNDVLNIRVILKVFTVKMEILLEPTSNKLLVVSYKDGDGDASFQLKSDSLPHAHAQTTNTYYKHRDSRIKKAQLLKTKTFANSDKQDLHLRYQVYQGRLLASFQDDAKYEHYEVKVILGPDTMSESAFCKRFRSSYEISLSSSPLDLPSRKRYRGTSELVEDSEEDDDEEDEKIEESLDSDSTSEDAEVKGPSTEDKDTAAGDKSLVVGDEGPGMDDESYGLDDESRGLDDEVHSIESDGFSLKEEEEAVPGEEDHVYSTFEVGQGFGSAPESERPERVSASRQPTLTTWTDPEYGKVYIDVPAYPTPAPPVQTPPSPEWMSGSLLISPSPFIVPSPVSSPMIPLTVPSPVATLVMAETEGFLTELGAHVEMQGGLIRDHAVRLEELLPDLFERSLKYKQERVAVTFGAIWRPVLALESWAGQTDAQRAALWHAISDMQGENQDLRSPEKKHMVYEVWISSLCISLNWVASIRDSEGNFVRYSWIAVDQVYRLVRRSNRKVIDRGWSRGVLERVVMIN
ncbi:hypothetical protein Tco_0150527 [Tanacetum coccineum]